MTISALYQLFLECTEVCTDTRKINKDCLFTALKGENFNGNKFAQEAIDKGAKYVIIDEKAHMIPNKTVLVENSLETLQKLANYHRRSLNIPIIALTGSNGKTTTKELIAQVLNEKYQVVATKGNLNNHIGVPLTLLAMNATTEIGVVEMGANHQKEIELLATITEPNYGYITNFGKAHLEGFGGLDGVIKGKSELYTNLIDREQTLFINTDDDLQVKQAKQAKNTITFGSSQNVDYQIHILSNRELATIEYQNTLITSHLIGDYNAKNMVAATAIGLHFGISIEKIKRAIESYIPENNRSQVIRQNSNKLILDAYNANPTSMELALKNFLQQDLSSKIVILGDMFEVGKTSLEEHQHIVDILENSHIKDAFVCGENFNQTQTLRVHQFKTFEELKIATEKANFKNKEILIKGSRGMQLERLLTVL